MLAATPTRAPLALPLVLLRLEGVALLVGACLAYGQLDAGWGFFFALLFVPDVSMVGYLRDPRLGALLYNAGHSLLGPALLLGAALTVSAPTLLAIAVIWFAHIGMDRALGYGLKHTDAFLHTHLSPAA